MATKFDKETGDKIWQALSVLEGQPASQVPMGKSLDLDALRYTVKADGSLDVEGWISTPAKDIEKDVIEPEAFSGSALSLYMKRGAQVSAEHQTKSLPVGFMHKARLVRNGQVLQDEDNPNHPQADFKWFSGGSGWYGLVNIYDRNVLRGISKGTVRAFSWIGMPLEWEPLPDGGKHFTKPGAINPLIEATVTGFPVNLEATMRIAKAHGFSPKQLDLEKYRKILADPMVVDAVVSILIPTGTVNAVVEEVLKRNLTR